MLWWRARIADDLETLAGACRAGVGPTRRRRSELARIGAWLERLGDEAEGVASDTRGIWRGWQARAGRVWGRRAATPRTGHAPDHGSGGSETRPRQSPPTSGMRCPALVQANHLEEQGTAAHREPGRTPPQKAVRIKWQHQTGHDPP